MSVFDVRGNGVGEITEIVFSGGHGYDYASKLVKQGPVSLTITDEDGDSEFSLKLVDVPNMILALQKVVELDWLPKPVVKKTRTKTTK